MGFFNRDKMSREAGEWAATAMACLMFADGVPGEAEGAAAKGQIATNPLFKKSIGAERADALFVETLEAIRPVPQAMLPTYEVKLQELASGIDELTERNFALATVIAVAMGDRTINDAEYAMLARLNEVLGANIPIPMSGQSVPREYTSEQVGAGAEVPGADVACVQCAQATQFFEGYGHWCGSCGVYTQPSEESVPIQAEAPAESTTVACGQCGEATTPYEGYGNWCDPCQRYS